ncbi:hypothetical protein [Sphingobium nicotianae]|nr:hypothetical protein [Sphingobium nicotianae]
MKLAHIVHGVLAKVRRAPEQGTDFEGFYGVKERRVIARAV